MKNRALNTERRRRNLALRSEIRCLGRARFSATATDWATHFTEMSDRVQMTETGDVDREGCPVAPIVNLAAYGPVTSAMRRIALSGLPPTVEIGDKDPVYHRGFSNAY